MDFFDFLYFFLKLINSGIIDDWLELAFKIAEQEFIIGEEIRTAAMGKQRNL